MKNSDLESLRNAAVQKRIMLTHSYRELTGSDINERQTTSRSLTDEVSSVIQQNPFLSMLAATVLGVVVESSSEKLGEVAEQQIHTLKAKAGETVRHITEKKLGDVMVSLIGGSIVPLIQSLASNHRNEMHQ